MEKPLSLVAVVFVAAVAGCASWATTGGTRRLASTVDYLYPAAKEPPRMVAGFTYLRPPIRVGIAFVPDGAATESLSDVEKTSLLERIRAAFATYPFVSGIEVIPVAHLGSGGGFTNLQQVARMLDVEVIALLSCDQVQFDDPDALPVVYWTITGTSVIRGAPHETRTLVDASCWTCGPASSCSALRGRATQQGTPHGQFFRARPRNPPRGLQPGRRQAGSSLARRTGYLQGAHAGSEADRPDRTVLGMGRVRARPGGADSGAAAIIYVSRRHR